MIRKKKTLTRMLVLLLSLLFLSVFTAQVLFAVGVFGSDKHIKAGITCENCHGTEKVAERAVVSMTRCLSCHESYEKLAKRTEKMKLNPHVDYHLGVLECNECHHGHKADENKCESCHR